MKKNEDIVKKAVKRKTISNIDYYQPGFVKKRKKYIVLDEDEYLSQMGSIIKRDFFPLEKRETQIAKNISLNQFLEKYTSEDNESFNQIQEKDEIKKRKEIKWAYNQVVDLKTGEKYLTLQSFTNSAQPRIAHRLPNSTSKTPYIEDKKDSKALKTKTYGSSEIQASNTRLSLARADISDTESIFTSNTNKDSDYISRPKVNGFAFVIPPPSKRDLIFRKLTTKKPIKKFKRTKENPLTPAAVNLLNKLRNKK